jgi:DHA3 family tetracycline resistance protein-like MFS transporter
LTAPRPDPKLTKIRPGSGRPSLPSPAKLPAETVYLLLTGFYALTYSIVLTVSLVYQTERAGLNPFQLVAAGTVLQLTTFIFEIPTGVFADVRGRRLSVVIGVALLGFAFVLMGSSTSFWTILASQAIVGVALTFVSGAQEAWIADEVGVENASRIYLRSAQVGQYARLLGIPAAVGLGLISLRLPIMFGGFMFALLAAFLLAVMPEDGFGPRARPAGQMQPGFRQTFRDGTHLVRTTPILITLFGMVAFYELSGEVFIRLSVAHFLNDVGLPRAGHLESVVWFGIMRMAAALAGLLVVQYVRRNVDTTNHQTLTTWLLRINILQMASLLVFAFTTSFGLGVLAYLVATSLSRMFQPLYLAMVNIHSDSSVRATVISMSSQVDALGQTIGAPILGAVASLASIRTALVGTAAVLLPAIGLNFRAADQQRRAGLLGSEPAD